MSIKNASCLEAGYQFGKIAISKEYELISMSETTNTMSQPNFHEVMLKYDALKRPAF